MRKPPIVDNSTHEKEGGSTVGNRHFKPQVKRARPIISRRDYEAVRHLLTDSAEIAWDGEAVARLEALIRETTDYESRFTGAGFEYTIGWTEYVFVPGLDDEFTPHRRWNDESLRLL